MPRRELVAFVAVPVIAAAVWYVVTLGFLGIWNGRLRWMTTLAAAEPVPPELSALAAAARLEAPIVAWCRGHFQSGRRGAFAVAVSSANGVGRYLVIESDATVLELAPFTGGAGLSCHGPAAARRLDRSIRQSETIEGQISPAWTTTVVCGFVEDTRAVCWQYSPGRRAFVKVGGWIT